MSPGVLRNHAQAVLADAYYKAVERAAAETGLPAETFPAGCPYTPDQLLSADMPLSASKELTDDLETRSQASPAVKRG